MDIVLGVSMTPTTVRMVLVEGEKADGVTVDHDVFDVKGEPGSATSGAANQVVDAVLGTKESAETGGHHLKSIGVTWSDHTEAAALREALAARGIDDVLLVSDGHAAAALAQAVGRAVGYDTTALFFIDRDTATLSVVQTDDGSVVMVLSRTLHSDDAMAVLTDMAAAVDAQESPPQAMFVVGSGVDITSVKNHLEHLVSLPVSAPDEPDLALARGAALAAANAPAFEASTVGLAYSQDPDGPTAGSAYAALAAGPGPFLDGDEPQTDLHPVGEERKPFLLVGSALTSIFIVGVVALVISLAVSIRPTADQRPSPGQSAIVPSTIVPAPAPPVRQEAQPVEAPPPPPPAETIKAPIPVVQEAPQAPPPRTVYVEAPAAPAPAPPPAAPPPPPPAAPAPVPVAPAPIPAPVYIPPPVYNPPPMWYPRPRSPWNPPWRPPRPTYDPPTPTWTPPKPPWNPPWEEPDKPQNPKWPPWENGSGSRGPDSGSSPGSRGSGDYGPGSRSPRGSGGSNGPSGRGGSGGSGGNNCFLIFCS